MSLPGFFQRNHLFADVTHKEDGPVLGQESRCSGITDGNGKTESALRFVSELSIAIETEPNFLIVDDHFL
jgi:hypothetical protein